VKIRHRIIKVRYDAPVPYGVEVMTLAQLREITPPDYLYAPQRPAFHLLILGSSGQATHTVDFRGYLLGRGSGVWVRPGQVQRFSDLGRVSGDLVLFQPDFLIPGTQAAAIADDRFGAVEYDFPETARDGVGRARRALSEEYARALRAAAAGDAVQAETLRHLLSVLILRVAAAGPTAPGARSGPDRLHDRFRDLVERDFAFAHDVDHYARALGYSARTLSRATQAAGGQTPKQMIQERIALEAARLLAHSDLAVTSIAAKLGFRDPSNFSAFFAQQTETAPTEFRMQQRQSATVA
jgi:AraC-like DNA-binding protein